MCEKSSIDKASKQAIVRVMRGRDSTSPRCVGRIEESIRGKNEQRC